MAPTPASGAAVVPDGQCQGKTSQDACHFPGGADLGVAGYCDPYKNTCVGKTILPLAKLCTLISVCLDIYMSLYLGLHLACIEMVSS